MEILMGILLGLLCMLILMHGTVLLLAAACFRRPKDTKSAEEVMNEGKAETKEKSEEERRAELEMKLFNEGIANILSYDTRPRGERGE